MTRQEPKLVALEAVRGIAALVVLAHHILLAFAPRLHGVLYPEQPNSLFGTPLFAAINGSAAVIVFFVLSGFVLTLRIVAREDAVTVPVAALKRWPRLVLPVLAVQLASAALVAGGLNANLAAAAETRSTWLQWWFRWPAQGGREFANAALEGLTTFFTGAFSYNSNLWTMYYEFWGSMAALGCALLYVWRPNLRGYAILAAVAWLAATWWTNYMAPFVAGAALAVYYARRPAADWPPAALWALPALMLVCGYHENGISGRPEGWYAVLQPLAQPNPLRLRVVLHTAAAVSMLLLVLKVAPLRRLLSGPAGARLGALSFPIYLTHLLAITSVGSWTFLACSALPHPARVAAAAAATVAATLIASVPLARLDRWWVGALGGLSRRAVAALRNALGGRRSDPGRTADLALAGSRASP